MSDDPGVGVLLFVAYRELERSALEAVRAAGFDITQAQARLAARLSPAGMRLTDLAESARVTKQTASVLVDQLVRGGYVERHPDPRDARARVIALSRRGHAMADAANAATRAVLARWTEHLGTAEMEQLHTSLVRLREITDPYLDDET